MDIRKLPGPYEESVLNGMQGHVKFRRCRTSNFYEVYQLHLQVR